MKAILEFDLPEDSSEFDLACRAAKFHGVLWDLDQWLRGIIKYDNVIPPEHIDVYQKVRDRLHEELSSNGVSLDA